MNTSPYPSPGYMKLSNSFPAGAVPQPSALHVCPADILLHSGEGYGTSSPNNSHDSNSQTQLCTITGEKNRGGQRNEGYENSDLDDSSTSDDRSIKCLTGERVKGHDNEVNGENDMASESEEERLARLLNSYIYFEGRTELDG